MSKRWDTFVAKLNEFKTLPETSWNYYHLLGYMLDKTGSQISPVVAEGMIINVSEGYDSKTYVSPSRHPYLESMRWIYREFNKSGYETKKFLDWCLAKYGSKLKTSKLKFVLDAYLAKPEEKKDRTTVLPDNIKNLFSFAKTYGDLAFAIQDKDMKNDVISKLITLDLTIEKLGLDKIV